MECWNECINLKDILHNVVKEFHKKRNQYSTIEKNCLSHKEFAIVREVILNIYKKLSKEETTTVTKRNTIVECSKLLLEWITTENHDNETRINISGMNQKKILKNVMKAIFDKKEEVTKPILKLPNTDETASCNLFESKEEFKKLSSPENLFHLSY